LDRDTSTGDLTLQFKKDLKSGLDNITLDSDGSIWITSHPKLLAFASYAKNPNNLSPSQVFKLETKGSNDFIVEEVYLNNGEEISASSTALQVNGRIYIGCVFENKLLQGEYTK
jgi:arylesterase/paraoxonase